MLQCVACLSTISTARVKLPRIFCTHTHTLSRTLSNCTLPLVTPLECGEWDTASLPAPITVQAVEYAAVQPVGYRIIAQECVENRLCL